jgi:uncharacterized LabA/DUF88 family protein
MPTAVVVDGAFFLRRFTYSFPNLDHRDAVDVAFGVVCMAAFHVATRLQADGATNDPGPGGRKPEETSELYRIFFYDCPPLTKRVHAPVSKRSIHLGASAEAQLRIAIHAQLRRTRKVAVRLGRLNDKITPWRLKTGAVDRWRAEGFAPHDNDFELDVIQKGVDMRLGLDIASMAYKRQVDQIILVAADADFVPPAKLARREGIDVVLDPMGAGVATDLLEHVDGVRMCRMDVASRKVGAR